MRRLVVLVTLLCLLFSPFVAKAEYFTLEMALKQGEKHPDYLAWEASVKGAEEAIETLLKKEKAQLDFSGTPLDYSYNLDLGTASASLRTSLRFAKGFLAGPNLNLSVTPSKSFSKPNWRLGWSAGLSHTLWPTPQFNPDLINLRHNENTLLRLAEQRDYVLASVGFKIEELYKTAQLVKARVEFAKRNLQAEIEAFQVLQAKQQIGEAGEVDLITGKLNMLRAEKELEQAEDNARAALEQLRTALALESKEIKLAPLTVSPISLTQVSPSELDFDLEKHPLMLSRQLEIEKAEQELKAAQAALKPGAGLTMNVNENTKGELTVSAAITISYSFLDGNQKKDSVKERDSALESLVDSFASEVAKLEERLADGLANLAYLEREMEIASLTLQKTELEWDAAKKQHVLGMIDTRNLERHEIQLQQAQLNFYEAALKYDLAVRRLQSGILGDLTGGSGGR